MKKKKYNHDFVGVCELRQLPKNAYFRVVQKNGKIGNTIYKKEDYDRSSKTFYASKTTDIWGNGRNIKGTQKVTTDFYY